MTSENRNSHPLSPRQKSRETNKRPLRTIVDTFTNEHGSIMERLECGHAQVRKSDIYGPTNAYRRRCRKCAEQRHQRCMSCGESPIDVLHTNCPACGSNEHLTTVLP